MALLDIITYGHPTLRQRAQKVAEDQIDPALIQDILETMYVKDGVGLAAPQVNVSKKILVATDFKEEYVLINPEIIAHSEQVETDSEGCLSVPGFQGEVDRFQKIVVRALDASGKPIEITARGFLARVLQHEIDHLNGILYIDRALPDSLHKLPLSEDEDPVSVSLDEIQNHFHQNDHVDRRDVVFERTQPLA